jgi:hypothetical protein
MAVSLVGTASAAKMGYLTALFIAFRIAGQRGLSLEKLGISGFNARSDPNGTYLSQEPPSFRRRPDKSAKRVERLKVGPKGERSESSRNTATIKQSGSRPAPG